MAIVRLAVVQVVVVLEPTNRRCDLCVTL